MKGSAKRRPGHSKPPTDKARTPGLRKESPEMTDPEIRLFETDDAVAHVGEGLIACTLPRLEWTHEAHLGACLYIVRNRPDVAPERDLPGIIRRYNESVGGVNDDHNGYHETITQIFIAAVRAHLSERSPGDTVRDAVNSLLLSERGKRDWPLRRYSRARLFSVEARRGFVPPDLV
jgi:hypothetical protein